MFDVITFGSATVDIFAETTDERVFNVDGPLEHESLLAYPSGSKLLIHQLRTDIGGGGTNTAACFSELGLKTAYCGCLGKDNYGDQIVTWLADEDITFLGSRADRQTNLSIILDSTRIKDRTILVHRDASDWLCLEESDLRRLQSTWFYFSSLMGQAFDMMKEIVAYGRKHGIAIAFNPSMYQAKHGLEVLGDLLKQVQLFVLNKEEAELLVGKGTTEELCVKLREHGGEIVMVTNGKEGASLLYADTVYTIVPQPHKVIETTGAGDCFASTFLAGLNLGKTPEDSLRMAAINAEHLIGFVGAKNGVLPKDKLLAELAKKKHKIAKRSI